MCFYSSSSRSKINLCEIKYIVRFYVGMKSVINGIMFQKLKNVDNYMTKTSRNSVKIEKDAQFIKSSKIVKNFGIQRNGEIC